MTATTMQEIFKNCRTPEDFLAIPESTFQAAMEEERKLREAAADAYWNRFDEVLDPHPIGHPHSRGG